MASNYDDVCRQLREAGLIFDRLSVGDSRTQRCRVEDGGREKRGWYRLHELRTSSGDTLIVGSFGVWRADDNNAQKVELGKSNPLTTEQRESLRRRLAEDRKRMQLEAKRAAEAAARRANAAWAKLLPDGDSDYLAHKHVGAHGLRFTENGSAVLPVLDTGGRIHGLQFLRSARLAKEARRPAKEFWPGGMAKKGHFFLLGAPDWLILVAEGYATAATLHEATGYPVAVAFDAGNLAAVARALQARYKRAKVLVCADDDAFTEGNPGITAASAVAMELNGAWIAPKFADEEARQGKFAANGHKLTDFNDLHTLEGLHVVRAQVEARLSELQWRPNFARASTHHQGERGDDKLRPVDSLDELLKRYALVYAHSGAVFDRKEHILMSISDMRDACIRKDLHKAWCESPDREIVRIRDVGFDPTESDPEITCNLWAGWPTEPQAGKCERLLEMLWHMCSIDRQSAKLYDWVLKWLALPLQRPGAKMKTTVVVHGPQGTGKNLFFEAIASIYGQYGDVIDQSAVEDRFNDWASRKLFMIADEVVARSDLFHIKNKLKGLITGNRIRINPKNIGAYWERNHMNLVFLSNETMPVVLEEDDRRHCVIWTPDKREESFYLSVLEELKEGGVAALHHHLLHLDLGEFGVGAAAPMTDAKNELINLGLDSPTRFYYDLMGGEVHGVKVVPCLSMDIYDVYKAWCTRNGVRAAPMAKFVNQLERKHQVPFEKKRYLDGMTVKGPHSCCLIGLFEPPADTTEQAYLGNSIEAFRNASADYKGGH